MAGSMFEEKTTKISAAIQNDDLLGLKDALKNDEDPHHTDRKGNTYLHYVCTMHRPCIFHVLVSSGINVNAQNRHGNTALHVTALQNDCSHVGDLLAAGIDPTIRNRAGKIAAEIETKNKFWRTVYDKYQPGIFQAVEEHNVEKVLYLLHCWCRVDAKRGKQTLRQYAASRKFHDLVFHIDKHQHTMDGIYAVLEGDADRAKQLLFHSKCDVNHLNFASETSHILQHALKMKDARQIRMICRAKANLNVRVTLNCYLKAPLFFAAFDPSLPVDIMWTMLKSGLDFTLKDERGRNAAIYALDKTDRKVAIEVISFMMANGLDVSQRDMTGVTLRDVARFARRKDILSLMDKAYVKTIRTSDIKELKRLCIMGYDGMMIKFNYRDSFIYASGNETEDALNFIQELPRIRSQIRQLHHGIRHWSRDKINQLLKSTEWPEILMRARDKGGRTAVHLCILHWRLDLLRLFLVEGNCTVDNVGRSPFHYACCLEEETEREQFCEALQEVWGESDLPDYKNRLPKDLTGKVESTEWIKQERKIHYGMERQLQCVDKYEELCHMMKYKGKNLKHFENSVCRFRHPLAKFHDILSPLMPEYRDLLLVAMDNRKEDIATRLIQLGSDWNLTDWVDASGKSVKRDYRENSYSESEIKESESKNNHMCERMNELIDSKEILIGNSTLCKKTEGKMKEEREEEDRTNNALTISEPGTTFVTAPDQNISERKSMNNTVEKVTVEERARRLGMFKVCTAIDKKKAHRERKLKAATSMDVSRSSSRLKTGDQELKGSDQEQILIPVRVSISKPSTGDFYDEHKCHENAIEKTGERDVVFHVESLPADSDTHEINRYRGNNRDNEDSSSSDEDEECEDDYSDDQFYSEDNSFSGDENCWD